MKAVDIFFGTIMIIGILLWALIAYTSCLRRIPKSIVLQHKNDPQFMSAYKRANYWLLWSITWIAIDYYVTIFAFAASMTAVYSASAYDGDVSRIIFYSIISAFLTTFGFAMNPKRWSCSYRKAFFLVEKQLDIYLLKIEEGDDSGIGIFNAITEGEIIINRPYGIDDL